ncbi:MAG: PilN domain-containing protein [Thermodesulfobacteriota bacterium]|nr:PilN domain-containing protein [Thermodesulfobacteriota bacterium]
MVTINLLPIKSQLRQKALIEHISLIVLCILFIVTGLGFYQSSVQQQRSDIKAEIASTKMEIKKLTVVAGEIEQFKKRKQALERKLEIIQSLNKEKTAKVEILDQVSIVIPEKAWITSMNNKGKGLVMEGVALDNPTIATFMKKLQRSEYFNHVELVLSQQKDSNHQFTIKCQIRIPS